MTNTFKQLKTTIRLWLIHKLYAIPKEERDRSDAKLGAIIENHIDDETWLMKQLGIEDHYKFREVGCKINRPQIKAFLKEERYINF